MKAIIFEKYGMPEEVLKIGEVKRPVPKKDEVLIQVKATAINDYEWSMVRGKPYLYRLFFGIFKPKHNTPGMELAGVVDAVGTEVQNFKAGDLVFGDISGFGFGTFAEYVCVKERAVISKPDKMSFEEAASIPHASLLALQALNDPGQIGTGKKILINGAGGGVGTFGFQLARLHDCEITGVDTGDKLAMMKKIGFDHVIDYKKESFTENGLKYDLILDCKSNRSPFAYLNSLNPGGKYWTVGGKPSAIINVLLWGKLLSMFSSKRLQILSLKPNKGLDQINQLYIEDKIKCIMDGPYAFEEIPRLIQYFGEGKHQGKIVIKIS